MRIDRQGDRAICTLTDYEDLLKIRTLPEYRFVGDTTVDVSYDDLAQAGLAVQPNDRHIGEPHSGLFDYQAWVVRRAAQRERFAIFADTGLGKSYMGLDWARLVTSQHQGRTLIVAPLNVCRQWIAEAAKFYGAALTVEDLTSTADLHRWMETPPPAGGTIGVTNYEKLDRRFDNGTSAANDVAKAGASSVQNLKYNAGEVWPVEAVVLDESSMLKGFGTRKWSIVSGFDGVRFKLCLSATPAPNQRTEFAQHALFLGQVRSTTEYLTNYFMNRDGDWQFKPHSFDAWMANLTSWAVFLRDPKRWGFDDHRALLPTLHTEFPLVELTDDQRARGREHEHGDQPSLFGATPGGITSRTKMMQIAHGFVLDSGRVAESFPSNKPEWIVNKIGEFDEQVIVWVTFDEEGDRIEQMCAKRGVHAVHLSGRTNRSERDRIVELFRSDDPEAPQVLILKPGMFGFGVNLQSCAVQIFSTITDSFERFYQCVRRSYRFGQTRPVRVFVPVTPLDEAICQNVMNKQTMFMEDAETLEDAVVARLRPADTSEVKEVDAQPMIELDRAGSDKWTLVHCDSIAHMRYLASLPESQRPTFDHCVFSPPFAALYAYSQALGDMGNVRSDAEFRLQWKWFAEALLPLMRPGRIVAIHCKEIIRFANSHGYRHCYDFPSDLRDGMVDAGFRYQRRITIWKNPQLEATRNKETSLLHVTAKRDATQSFPQTGEYLMVFTAPDGDGEVKVTHDPVAWSFEHHTAVMNTIWPEPDTPDDGEIGLWRDQAEAERLVDPDGTGSVWTGIRETDVLNARVAKEKPEERHVCPLQLSLIRRSVELWTNPGELVFSPFGGIGSEGWEALGAGRRFYGCELKRSYFDTACRNLRDREGSMQATLFDMVAEPV